MIVGNIIFLSGLLINSDFRRNSKNLIIFHSGYIVQMFLEDNNIHLENDYTKIKNEFSLYHKNNGNIRAHLITTVVGFIALVGYLGNLSESSEILKCLF